MDIGNMQRRGLIPRDAGEHQRSSRLRPPAQWLPSLILASHLIALPGTTSAQCGPAPVASHQAGEPIRVAPIRTGDFQFRGPVGEWAAPRNNGKQHDGVDLVANKSAVGKDNYAVMATAAGVVAYAHMNGDTSRGYGYTVVIDHRNGWYTLYAHLATNASTACVKLGDLVEDGQIIGYVANLPGEISSGNAHAAVVKDWDKIQLHLELFSAQSGRSSTGGIDVLKRGGAVTDPSPALKRLGVLGFPP